MGICILHSLFWFGHWFLFFGIDVAQHSLGVLCCVLFFRSRRGLSYFIYFFTEGLGVGRIGTLKMLRYPVFGYVFFSLSIFVRRTERMGWTGYMRFSGRGCPGSSSIDLSGRYFVLLLPIYSIYCTRTVYIYTTKSGPCDVMDVSDYMYPCRLAGRPG